MIWAPYLQGTCRWRPWLREASWFHRWILRGLCMGSSTASHSVNQTVGQNSLGSSYTSTFVVLCRLIQLVDRSIWHCSKITFADTALYLPMNYDCCIYANEEKSQHVALYVDDGLACSEFRESIEQLLEYLKRGFGTSDYSDLRHKVQKCPLNSLCGKCLNGLQHDSLQCGSNSCWSHCSFKAAGYLENTELSPYHQVIGSLMCRIIGTRPDICYAIGKLSQFLEHPSVVNWNAAKRVLKDVCNTKNFRHNSEVTVDLDGTDSSLTVMLILQQTRSLAYLLLSYCYYWTERLSSGLAANRRMLQQRLPMLNTSLPVRSQNRSIEPEDS